MPQGPNLAPSMDQPPPMPMPSPVAVQTAQSMRGQENPDPTVYYGGKTGAIADVADKVLKGWMAGKYLGEQKAREKAASQIGTMKDAVDTVGQAYRAAVEGGDPKKIEAAGNVLKQQWDEYNAAREKYVVPSDLGKDGKKKSTAAKAGGAVKGAFAPHGPELYLQAALNASKQIDPRDLYGPSKKEEQETKLTNLQTKEAELSVEEKTAKKSAQDEYNKAVAGGDATAIDKAAQKLQVWGVKVEPPSDAQLRELKNQLDKEVTQSALTGLQSIKAGGKTMEQLPEDQQGAMVKLGIAPQVKNALQAYLKQVGPGKQFKDDYAATKQYMLDERTTHIMGEKPTPLEELRSSAKIILQHDMQDLEKAKKAGIQPLKPGQEPPRWLVEQEAEKRYKHLKDDDEDAGIYKATASNKIITKALSGFSPVEQEQIKRTFLTQDESLGTQQFNQNPSLQGMNPQEASDLYKKFRERSANWAQQMYPHATTEKINEIFGPIPEALRAPQPTGMNQRRGGYSGSLGPTPPPPGPDGQQGMSAPPTGPKEYPAQGKYVVAMKGQGLHAGQAVELTAEEAKKAAEAGYELTQQ